MNMKKLIAYITLVAMLLVSINITAFASDVPTAEIGATVCNGNILTGAYTYTGTQGQGNSIYRWYASDSFFDKGALIEGADKQTLTATKDTNGKFLTFAVVPVAADGTQGEEICADPIMQNQGYYEDFLSGVTNNMTSTLSAEGYVGVVDAPGATGEKALKVFKEFDSSFKAEARIKFDDMAVSKSVVEADIYVENISGISRLFGVYDDNYGSVIELQTDGAGDLYYRAQGDLTEADIDFEAGVWNHISIEINSVDNLVKASVNGESIFSGEKKWRFENPSYNNVASQFINYGNGGTVYIKNLAVMNLMGQESAEMDASALTDMVPDETVSSFPLPSSGEYGSAIYWKSSMPQYITDEGVVTRPAYGQGDADVVMTAYVINGSALIKKDIIITVPETTLPPVAEDVTISQNGTRFVQASYEYVDENDDDERGSIYRWYVETEDGYKIIEGEDEMIFVPTAEYDGKNIKFSVTPDNTAGIIGVETFSEPLRYQYIEARAPYAEITSKKTDDAKGFVFKYKYTSDDYLEEGTTLTKWYVSETLFGEYKPVEDADGLSYMPANKAAYYKFALTPVDEEGNAGEEIVTGPFTWASSSTAQSSAVNNAILAIKLPEDTFESIELPTKSAGGALYTWISSNPDAMTDNGVITRPAADAEDAVVELTVYAMCGFESQSATYNVTVNKYTTPPVISEYELYQESRPIRIRYTYTDAEENAPKNINFKWYYKATADAEFTLIEGADSDMYAPAQTMDGYIFKAEITPEDESWTVGETVTTAEYTYEFLPPAIPTANVLKTGITGTTLEGNYEYVNPDGIAEGESVYKWYTSDKLFGTYKAVTGAKDKSLAYDSSYDGKYVKFTVTPKDIEGVTGETYEATPVLITFEEAETFDEDYEISKIDTSSLAGGVVSIEVDPKDPANTALKLQRTSEIQGEQSMIKYLIPEFPGSTGLIIEADLYSSSSNKGTWEMFYICGTGVAQTYKVWNNGTNFYSRGGAYTDASGKEVTDSSMVIATNFTKDTWHNVRIVMDTKNQMMRECWLDGILVQTDMTWRSAPARIAEIVSFFQNNLTGIGYMDNVRVTPVYSSEGNSKAEADAKAIDLGVDLNAVIKNIKLPATGTVNGSAITWISSDESVITSKGKVKRPESAEGDKQVTLTAYVVKGNEYFTKEFNVNVMRILENAEISQYDADELSALDGSLVSSDMKLITKGRFGSDIIWASSDEAVIANNGTVVRYNEKKAVTLTATITCGDSVVTKEITVTVVPNTGESLVLNGGVGASSAMAQYQIGNANDDDYSTYWTSLPSDTNPYIIMDFGKVQTVNQLYIADESKSIEKFTLYASDDKSEWNPITLSGTYVCDVVSTVNFADTSARYIKMDFSGNSGPVSANELKVLYVDNTSSGDGSTGGGSTGGGSTGGGGGAGGGTSTGAGSNGNGVSVGGGITGDTSVGIGGFNSAVGSVVPSIEPTAPNFGDIQSVPWAKEAIDKLSAIGVVNGTSDTTFEPERNITREEFAAILYRGFGFEKASVIDGYYKDVPLTEWYFEPVMQLATLGIINGNGDGTFGTGSTITRQDMAVMIYRAAQIVGTKFADKGIDFADKAAMATYAYEAVEALSGAQIINGVGGNCFNPTGKATRAEATVILSRIMDYMK